MLMPGRRGESPNSYPGCFGAWRLRYRKDLDRPSHQQSQWRAVDLHENWEVHTNECASMSEGRKAMRDHNSLVDACATHVPI